MCGITGWVSYTRDPRARMDVLSTMVETMACRGPDAAGSWVDGHTALGHRRLAVIDLEGGAQPMRVDRDGRDVLALTYSGEVYNYLELRAELAARGHVFRTQSDTEVILQAYLAWGPEFVNRLNGMYAFALWDPAREELLLVRDRLGIKPLYYYPLADGVIFGSEPKAIFAHPEASAGVGPEGLAEILSLIKTPGHAVYRGMYELRPGHVLRVTSQGLATRCYWELEARDHTDSLSATVGHVRDLLEDVVTRQLIADVPLCTLLSGGLDSSVITALAARFLGEQGRGPVRSFAVDFAGQGENFAADSLRGTPDAPFAHLLAAHVGAEHTDIVLDAAQLSDRANTGAVLRAYDLPGGLGEGDTSLYLLFKAIRARSTVALSGESADEVFGGYAWFHDEKAVAADTYPWLAAVNAGGFSGGATVNGRLSFISPDVQARLDLPEYVAARYHEAIAEVPRLPGEDGLERRMREVGYLHLTRFLPVLLDRKDRMSMAVGLEVRVPFCDHRLVDYVFNAPWAMKTFDGREKSLLRAATRDLLPPEISERVKSPYPSTKDPAFDEDVRKALREVLADPESPVLALLDRQTVSEVVESAPGREVRVPGEIVLSLDAWLRGYDVELEI